MSPDASPNHGFDLNYQEGEAWSYNSEFSALDQLVPHELHSEIITHTTGSSTTVRVSGITAEQQTMFSVEERMDEYVSASLGVNTDVSKFWDEPNGYWAADITFNWDQDPGVSVDFLISVQETSLST